MESFFSSSEARRVKRPLTLIPACGECQLERYCASPKIPVYGKGRLGILLVSEYPGKSEDRTGIPMSGGMGQFLREELGHLGVDMDRDCWRTNAQICYDSEKRKPKKVIEFCRPNLLNTIKELQPTTIILMGGAAIESLIGHLWKESVGTVGRWVGWQIPNHKPNCWITPTYNPAHLMRAEGRDPVTLMDFRAHLRAAVALDGVPHPNGPPDYERAVEPILDATRAAERIRAGMRHSRLAAFDFEATCLKPDGPAFEIVCCSICFDGQETISFPWHGAVIPAMLEFLTDTGIGKIAANLKYEARVCKARLGIDVAGWAFDTMQAAHVLDPRPKISGLKFQAFCKLGCPDYNHHIAPLLESREDGGNAPNRIREIAMRQLLVYCGVDSLLEYELAMIQSRELGIDLLGGEDA